MKKVGKILGNILITIVLIFSIFMTVVVISSTGKNNTTGLPNFFGKAMFNVLTDSMESEEGFKAGSVIFVDLVDPKDNKDVRYQVGDVVTFWYYPENSEVPVLNTHRIVSCEEIPAHLNDVPKDEVIDGVWVHGDTPYYVTKGDHEHEIDYKNDKSGADFLTNDRIVAVWNGGSIPFVGTVMNFLKTPVGFGICVVVPTLIFFFFELFKFVSILMETKKQKALEAVKNAEEEIKQKVVAEMLAKQEAEKSAAQPAPAAAPTPAPVSQDSEEEIKRKAVEEYLAQQEAEKAAAAREEEIKKQAIAEYLAKHEAEKQAAESTQDNN